MHVRTALHVVSANKDMIWVHISNPEEVVLFYTTRWTVAYRCDKSSFRLRVPREREYQETYRGWLCWKLVLARNRWFVQSYRRHHDLQSASSHCPPRWLSSVPRCPTYSFRYQTNITISVEHDSLRPSNSWHNPSLILSGLQSVVA